MRPKEDNINNDLDKVAKGKVNGVVGNVKNEELVKKAKDKVENAAESVGNLANDLADSVKKNSQRDQGHGKKCCQRL